MTIGAGGGALWCALMARCVANNSTTKVAAGNTTQNTSAARRIGGSVWECSTAAPAANAERKMKRCAITQSTTAAQKIVIAIIENGVTEDNYS